MVIYDAVFPPEVDGIFSVSANLFPVHVYFKIIETLQERFAKEYFFQCVIASTLFFMEKKVLL